MFPFSSLKHCVEATLRGLLPKPSWNLTVQFLWKLNFSLANATQDGEEALPPPVYNAPSWRHKLSSSFTEISLLTRLPLRRCNNTDSACQEFASCVRDLYHLNILLVKVPASGYWTGKTCHINRLELRAFFLALRSFLTQAWGNMSGWCVFASPLQTPFAVDRSPSALHLHPRLHEQWRGYAVEEEDSSLRIEYKGC